MSEGKQLDVGDFKIGMGEDLSIGFVMSNSKGETSISGFSDLTVKQLNSLLDKHNVWPISR